MHTGRDAVEPVWYVSGKWAPEQGAERRQPQSWLLEEGRRWWRSAEDGGEGGRMGEENIAR